MTRSRARDLTLVTTAVAAVVTAAALLARGPAPVEPAPRLPAALPTPARTPAPAFLDRVGLPADSDLDAYYGPCTVTEANTRIDNALVDCDRLVIAAANVRITRSQLPEVDVDGTGRSVVIEDSLVDGGNFSGAAIGYTNITVRRTEVRGAQHSVLCGTNCLIEDSWLHSQALPDVVEWHNNAFLSNGGTGVVIRGSVLQCTPVDNGDGGGCSGSLSFFGDLAPVGDIVVENNYFPPTPGGFCVRLGEDPGSKKFGDRTRNVTFRNNRFEPGPSGRCGAFGAVTSVPPGAKWANNRLTTGAILRPS